MAPEAGPPTSLRQLDPKFLEPNDLHGVGQVVLNAGAFLVLIVLAAFVQQVWLGVLLAVAIGVASHRLFFPIHDCMHRSLFRSRVLNNACGYLLAGMIGTPFHSMRGQHLLHHRLVGTAEDPGAVDYFVHFESRRQMVGFLLAPLLGITLVQRLFGYVGRFGRGRDQVTAAESPGASRAFVLGIVSVVVMQVALAAVLTHGFALNELWRYPVFLVVPVTLGFLFLNRLRMFSEHGSVDYRVSDYTIGLRPTNRTIVASPVERVLICGGNFNYHNEHHQFPKVPGCHLRHLHEEFLRQGMDPWDTRPTYWRVLAELWGNLSPRVRAERGP